MTYKISTNTFVIPLEGNLQVCLEYKIITDWKESIVKEEAMTNNIKTKYTIQTKYVNEA